MLLHATHRATVCGTGSAGFPVYQASQHERPVCRCGGVSFSGVHVLPAAEVRALEGRGELRCAGRPFLPLSAYMAIRHQHVCHADDLLLFCGKKQLSPHVTRRPNSQPPASPQRPPIQKQKQLTATAPDHLNPLQLVLAVPELSLCAISTKMQKTRNKMPAACVYLLEFIRKSALSAIFCCESGVKMC